MSGDDGWQADLERWLAPFLNQLSHPARRAMCPLYIAGLLGPGDRKSIQPMAHRLGMTSHDRLHHFVSAGLWDAEPLRAELIAHANRLVGGPDAYLVIDDTALPKKGADSNGRRNADSDDLWQPLVKCLCRRFPAQRLSRP
jgi:SRSO17 transposase